MSDHFIVNGYSHTCCCGSNWYDSDGGPCHTECCQCGKPCEETFGKNDDLCEKCWGEIVQENEIYLEEESK